MELFNLTEKIVYDSQYLQKILDCLPEGIVIHDYNKDVKFRNEQVDNLLYKAKMSLKISERPRLSLQQDIKLDLEDSFFPQRVETEI